MTVTPLAIEGVGLVTAVGHTAAASCAAFRAKVSNPSPTRFMDSTGQWILAHGVAMVPGLSGVARLVAMAVAAVREALPGATAAQCIGIPMLLCVAEKERPGRMADLDDSVLARLQAELQLTFSPDSAVIAQGRVSVPVAMALSRKLLEAGRASRVLIVATDSLLHWPTLDHLDREGRLLTQDNANGFMVGEGAGALLVGRPTAGAQLLCTGLGFAIEEAHIDSELPLRAEGLSAAIKGAAQEAGLRVDDFDYRITDLSGEQYYFKEAALALARTVRQSRPEFDLWHPAECTGEAGALAGIAIVALAQAAARKGYAKGPRVLAHMANDAGPRAAMALQFKGA
ncbi:MAG TPA: hypothetical protein VFW93_13515 [Aquabacterium sp.]|uniref:hypothetical protein n=1 Tax=Aquabacterium sp. TaxID=1872578 RepID=UPI002E35A82E|nr:hypothetical protein [Aquabacterium sp.]HEX5357231.1 hypothetical protein [Aquabacterium sp.]